MDTDAFYAPLPKYPTVADFALRVSQMKSEIAARRVINALRWISAYLREKEREEKGREDQPRVPAGQPGGGQWVGNNSGKPKETPAASGWRI